MHLSPVAKDGGREVKTYPFGGPHKDFYRCLNVLEILLSDELFFQEAGNSRNNIVLLVDPKSLAYRMQVFWRLWRNLTGFRLITLADSPHLYSPSTLASTYPPKVLILLLLLQALWHLTLSIYLSPACISDEWTCLALEAWPKRRLCSPNFVPFYPLRNLEAVTAPAEVTRLPQDPCVGAEQG